MTWLFILAGVCICIAVLVWMVMKFRAFCIRQAQRALWR